MMRSFIILAAASVLAACSSLKPYPSVAPENVVVKSAIESGSVLSSMRGAVHIHEVDASCHTSYVGTVKLDRPSIALGLPAERPSYLVFVFQRRRRHGAQAAPGLPLRVRGELQGQHLQRGAARIGSAPRRLARSAAAGIEGLQRLTVASDL